MQTITRTDDAVIQYQRADTGLSIYERMTDPIADIERLGKVFAASGMFGCEKVEQGQVLALACMCERQNPFQILRTYHLLGGRLTMRADAMLAEYRRRGGRVKWTELSNTAAAALWTYEETENLEIRYTMEDAKLAKLVKPGSAWEKTPGAMLVARLTSKAIRLIAPEVISGVYLPDERPIDGLDGSESTAAPLLPVNPVSPQGNTTGADAPTIDVQATPVKAAEPTPKKEPSAPKEKAAAKPAEPTATAAPEPPNKLEALANALRPHAVKCVEWWVKKDWLKPEDIAGKDPVKDFNQITGRLSAVNVDKMLAGTDRFIAAVNR